MYFEWLLSAREFKSRLPFVWTLILGVGKSLLVNSEVSRPRKPAEIHVTLGNVWKYADLQSVIWLRRAIMHIRWYGWEANCGVMLRHYKCWSLRIWFVFVDCLRPAISLGLEIMAERYHLDLLYKRNALHFKIKCTEAWMLEIFDPALSASLVTLWKLVKMPLLARVPFVRNQCLSVAGKWRRSHPM